MPRKNRELYQGAIYHVFDRGVAKQPVFHDDKDREKFLEIFEELCFAYNFVLHAFCLMGNHYHILLQTYEANMPEIMQRVLCKYAKHFNIKYSRVGYVFQDRYDDRNVYTEDYFATLFRYFALNPVEPDKEIEAQDYIWSSYHDYYYGKQRYSFLNKDLFSYLFEKYKMNKTDVYNYVSCNEADLALNYQFDSSYFRIKDQQKIPVLIDNKNRFLLIIEKLDSLNLKGHQRKRIIVYLMKKFTTVADKEIAKIAGYSSYKTLSRIYKKLKLGLSTDIELTDIVTGLVSKIKKDDTRDLHF